MRPRVLCIAGSDSGGGAGLQADVRTALAMGAHALTAVTAVTAQDSTAVHRVWSVPADVLEVQLRAVLDDIGADAVKVGLLPDEDAIAVTAAVLADLDVPVVVDPVAQASTGAALRDPTAMTAFRERIVPLATVLTPNADEATALVGGRTATGPELARAVHALGPGWVLLTGGASAVDLLFDGGVVTELVGEGITTRHGHGTGCTLSTALAVGLAGGADVPTAARAAKDYVSGALQAAYEMGNGPGPLGHAWVWTT